MARLVKALAVEILVGAVVFTQRPAFERDAGKHATAARYDRISARIDASVLADAVGPTGPGCRPWRLRPG